MHRSPVSPSPPSRQVRPQPTPYPVEFLLHLLRSHPVQVILPPIPNHPFIPIEFLLHLPHTPTIITEGTTITLALDQGLLNIHLHNRIPHLSCLRYT